MNLIKLGDYEITTEPTEPMGYYGVKPIVLHRGNKIENVRDVVIRIRTGGEVQVEIETVVK